MTSLSYGMTCTHSQIANDAQLGLHFNVTLESDPDSRMQYDVRWDGGDVQTHRLTEDGDDEMDLPVGWSQAVQDCAWKKRHFLGQVGAGRHTIEVRFRHLNIVMEKVILDLSGMDMEYLGPPESDYVEATV